MRTACRTHCMLFRLLSAWSERLLRLCGGSPAPWAVPRGPQPTQSDAPAQGHHPGPVVAVPQRVHDPDVHPEPADRRAACVHIPAPMRCLGWSRAHAAALPCRAVRARRPRPCQGVRRRRPDLPRPAGAAQSLTLPWPGAQTPIAPRRPTRRRRSCTRAAGRSTTGACGALRSAPLSVDRSRQGRGGVGRPAACRRALRGARPSAAPRARRAGGHGVRGVCRSGEHAVWRCCAYHKHSGPEARLSAAAVRRQVCACGRVLPPFRARSAQG